MQYLVMDTPTHTVENTAQWDGVAQWSTAMGYVALPCSDRPRMDNG
jgi:hypothetical protein